MAASPSLHKEQQKQDLGSWETFYLPIDSLKAFHKYSFLGTGRPIPAGSGQWEMSAGTWRAGRMSACSLFNSTAWAVKELAVPFHRTNFCQDHTYKTPSLSVSTKPFSFRISKSLVPHHPHEHSETSEYFYFYSHNLFT